MYADRPAAEMAEMRVKVTAAGNTQFGVWREGAHDDLVLAVALGVLERAEDAPTRPVWSGGVLEANGAGALGAGLRKWAQGRVV